MTEIEFVFGAPSAYSNYVWIERTRAETFRFEGLSNVAGGEPVRFTSRHYVDLESAKADAIKWAAKNGVTAVYLPPYA